MTPSNCIICGNEAGNRILSAREKMNGSLEPFDYNQCAVCGHLHLVSPIADMGAYYAKGYYSFHSKCIPAWRQWLYRTRTAALLGGGSWLGQILERIKPPFYSVWLKRTGLRIGDRLLDIGCGAGNLIRILHGTGLDCTGIDPFLPSDLRTPEGVELRKADLMDERKTYNGILFIHSFEHVPNPRELFIQAATLLEPGGCIVVRMPLSDSFAFFHYGPDWVQWDAPRHVNLFTKDSFRRLAEQAGLSVDETIDDSDMMQFWASEEYRLNIFHNSKESYGHNEQQTHFSKRQLRDFKCWSKWLNQMGAGDQATFICRKTPK